MRTLHYPLGIVLLLVIVGCSPQPSSQTPQPKPEEKLQSEEAAKAAPPPRQAAEKPAKGTPLERFQKFVAKLENELPKDLASLGDVQIAYDVRKTDSLVSPFMGIVNVRFAQVINKYQAQCNYAFQNDRWVLRNITVQLVNSDELPDYARGMAKVFLDPLHGIFRNNLILPTSNKF